MAINFVQAHSIGIAEGGGSNLTLSSFDVGSGANRTLVAIVTLEDIDLPSPTVSSVVFNGTENFTYRIRSTHNWATSIDDVIEIWTLDNPTNTTANIVATASESVDAITLHVLEYTGANNGVGANTGTSGGNIASASVSITTLASTSIIVGGVTCYESLNGGGFTATGGATERSEDLGSAHSTPGSGCSDDKAATGGADTLDVTISTACNWAMAAIELKAASGATNITVAEGVQAQVSDAASLSVVSSGPSGTESVQAQLSDRAILYSIGVASQGPLYPTVASEQAISPYNAHNWVATSINNIRADDTAYASIVANTFDTGTISHFLVGQSFGASIPTSASINGLLVEIGKWFSAGSARDAAVSLYQGSLIGSNLGSTTTGWPSSIATVSYGGSDNLWGTTPTPAMVNGTIFGVGISAVASALNTDVWVDFVRLTIYYTFTDGAFGINPTQAWQAQVSDAGSLTFSGGGLPQITISEATQLQVSDASLLGVWTPVAAAQNFQAQVSDASLLGVWTPITPAQANQAQVSDASTLGVFTPIAAAQNFQAQVSDASTMGVITPIAPAEAAQAQVSDAAILTAIYNITPAQANQAQVSDAAVLSIAVPTITATDANQAQVSDASLLSVVYILTPDQANQAQVSDAASFTVGAVNITPDQANQLQVSDAALLGVITPVTVDQSYQAQVSDASTLTVVYVITPDQANQAQVSDLANISIAGMTITTEQANQAQVSDIASLGVITPITVAQSNQAQVSDLASFSVSAIDVTPAQANQAQVSDAAILSTIYTITVSEARQAQVSDISNLGVITLITVSQANQVQVSDAVILSSQGPTYYITISDANQAQASDLAPMGVWTPITPAEAWQVSQSDLASLVMSALIYHGNRRLYQVNTRTTGEQGIRPINQVGTRKTVDVEERPTHSVGTRKDYEVDD